LVKRIPKKKVLDQRNLFMEPICKMAMNSSEFRRLPFTIHEIAVMRSSVHLRGWVPVNRGISGYENPPDVGPKKPAEFCWTIHPEWIVGDMASS
jgi:hypothetical protein